MPTEATRPDRTQDVERWVRELKAAGWTAVRFTRAGPQPIERGTTWRSPTGLLYRGPYLAWRVMLDPAYERTNDAR